MDNRELVELKRKVDENNRILKGLQSRARWSTTASVIKWFIYISAIVLAWYYVQPFIEKAFETIDTVQGIKAQVDGIDTNSIFDVFKQ